MKSAEHLFKVCILLFAILDFSGDLAAQESPSPISACGYFFDYGYLESVNASNFKIAGCNIAWVDIDGHLYTLSANGAKKISADVVGEYYVSENIIVWPQEGQISGLWSYDGTVVRQLAGSSSEIEFNSLSMLRSARVCWYNGDSLFLFQNGQISFQGLQGGINKALFTGLSDESIAILNNDTLRVIKKEGEEISRVEGFDEVNFVESKSSRIVFQRALDGSLYTYPDGSVILALSDLVDFPKPLKLELFNNRFVLFRKDRKYSGYDQYYGLFANGPTVGDLELWPGGLIASESGGYQPVATNPDFEDNYLISEEYVVWKTPCCGALLAWDGNSYVGTADYETSDHLKQWARFQIPWNSLQVRNQNLVFVENELAQLFDIAQKKRVSILENTSDRQYDPVLTDSLIIWKEEVGGKEKLFSVKLNWLSTVNSQAKIIEGQVFGVLPTGLQGEELGLVMVENAAGSELRFKISGGDPNHLVNIDQNTGQMTLNQDVSETTVSKIDLRVEVTDVSNLAGWWKFENSTVVIDILNETPAGADTTFEIGAGIKANSLVGQVSASDPEGDPIVYSLLSGHLIPNATIDNQLFTIESATGSILTSSIFEYVQQDWVNYTLAESYLLMVQVSDGRDQSTINVNIIVDDNPLLASREELLNGDQMLLVSPNPGKESFEVSLSGQDETIQSIAIWNLSGVLVKSFFYNKNNSVQLDLHDLHSGLYILAVTTDTGYYIKRIIIE